MNVQTAIKRIKSATHDISDEYSTERCLEFINTATQQIGSLLVANNYPNIVREIALHNGESIPRNYAKACGTYPICITDNRVEFLDDEEEIHVRYFSLPEQIQTTSEELPFGSDAINEVVVKTAIILALNENEYDVSQDTAILESLKAAIAGAMTNAF